MTKKTTELSAKEEARKAQALSDQVDDLDTVLAFQRATGAAHSETLKKRNEVLRQYQAARIAADRPRRKEDELSPS